MPVTVWKQVRRNCSVSRTSRPVLGSPGLGRDVCDEVDVVAGGVEGALELVVDDEGRSCGCGRGIWGVRERAMAWTLNQQILIN